MKNREIKFRVWNGSKMEYNIMAGFLGSFYVQGISENDAACMSSFNTKYSNEAPLMQLTGLKDRHGKDIYEGDILEYETMKGDKFIGPVRWGRYQFYKGEMVTWVASPIALVPETFKESILHDCEVVGNIYENPEYLKQK